MPDASSVAAVGYFAVDDGKFIDGRFLSDGVAVDHGLLRRWITVKQHNRQPTRVAPTNLREGQKWPKEMGGVCRHDPAFADMYGDCYICDVYNVESGKVNKPRDRTWGLMLLRKPVADATGKLVGMEDVLEEVTITENDVERRCLRPHIVVVNQAWSTFWSHYSPYLSMNGTVLDRDYRIFRKGSELDTDYPPAPFDPPLSRTRTPPARRSPSRSTSATRRTSTPTRRSTARAGARTSARSSATRPATTSTPASSTRPSRSRCARARRDNGPAATKPVANEPTDEELAALAARVQGQPAPQQRAEPLGLRHSSSPSPNRSQRRSARGAAVARLISR